jgi:hypothetical protein
MSVKIRDMAPAHSWYVRYWRKSEPYYILKRVFAFVVVEKDGNEMISGVDQDQMLSSLQENFAGYYHESDISGQLRQSSEEQGRSRAKP